MPKKIWSKQKKAECNVKPKMKRPNDTKGQFITENQKNPGQNGISR